MQLQPNDEREKCCPHILSYHPSSHNSPVLSSHHHNNPQNNTKISGYQSNYFILIQRSLTFQFLNEAFIESGTLYILISLTRQCYSALLTATIELNRECLLLKNRSCVLIALPATCNTARLTIGCINYTYKVNS